jgi:aminocarboxymuconate-semialdehyde decarboxylase
MFYRCIPASARAKTLRAPASRARGGRRNFTVDIHCHIVTPAADALARASVDPMSDALYRFSSEASREVNRRQGETIASLITETAPRLAIMDAAGIDVQAVSPAPHQYYYALEPGLGRETSRLINDRIAELVALHPDRFVGLGTVPLQSPELAVAELERAVKSLGLRGVELGTNVAGEELASPRFRPFWAKAEELGILVFLHPSGFTDGRRLAEHYFINVIGNPLDTTVAVSHLIFGGVLDAYPKLKICCAHGGGFLAAYSGRMDHAHGARSDCRQFIKRPPTSYLKKLYFDTIVFTHHQLEYLGSLYGSEHLLLGTDYPYDMAEADPVGFISSSPHLTSGEKAAMMGLNAAKLLRIKVPVAKKATAKKSSAKSRRRKR